MSPAAVLVVLLVAFTFLSVPVLQVSSGSSAILVQPEGSDDTPQSLDSPYSQSLQGFKTRGWDWASYADDDGLVDVIVSASSGSPEALSAFMSYKIGGFSRAFDGFSARVTVDMLTRYASGSNPAIDVYPDLQVNATLADSVKQIGADQVWSMTDSHGAAVRGSGIVVAIIDTGIDYTHPDLGGGIGPGFKVIGGYDFYNGDSNPIDDNGHGTHVAGIVAASGGITGVAPAASLLAYKVLGADGSGAMSNVILGIDAAMDPNDDGSTADHADVISMSLGGAGDVDDPICQAVRNAIVAGIVVVIAAGNSGPSMGSVASPGLTPEAITVGAIDDSNALAAFSSRGTPNSLLIKPEISAPGVNIVSTVPYSGTKHSSGTGYSSMSGTSMATPHVSGAAALILQMHPTWTPAEVKSALISGSTKLNESLWTAGAGGLWVPTATGQRLFASDPLISYGFAGDASKPTTVSNSGVTVSLTTKSSDCYSASAEGLNGTEYWSNVSSASPGSFSLSSGSSSTVTLSTVVPSASAPEGFYEGWITITGTGASLRIPFGFALLSRLTVHVLDMNGNEVFDPYGGVYVYDTPGVNVALGVRGDSSPSPPATFMLPSGQYNVHAAGHQLVYTYFDPYVLSGTVTVSRLQTQEITLRMTDAKQMTLNLATDEGKPIYVKDYRIYCRYVGLHNFSFHLVGSDYSKAGSAIFSLPTSMKVYISNTAATVGVSIAGFSYTSKMWDFMNRNSDHWYEFTGDSSTDFFIESTADLQYLLAWEFSGVSASTPTALSIDPAKASYYDTKYDIPGSLESVWGSWGTHLAVGGDSSFYLRRDTDTSLNPFFSGMTRKTIVQGVFSEPYFPGNLFQGYFVRPFFEPDYTHRVKADTLSEIYLPDRNFITPIEGQSFDQRLGVGPFYPSITTANTNDSLVMFYPLLRDQSGATVGGMYVPTLTLYRNGGLSGIYQLSEYLSRLPSERVIDLGAAGAYTAVIDYQPTPQICSQEMISLHFTVPSADVDPPFIQNLTMPQRFVPGSSIPVELAVGDDTSLGAVEVYWRTGGATAWHVLSVTSPRTQVYSTSIQTSASDESVDIKVKVYDASGNYIEYSAVSASMKQIPVIFELASDKTQIGFRDADVYVLLTGRLTNQTGEPLYPTAAVPLELMLNGQKVGMILDENVVSGSHSHDGTIRFEWHFNPKNIFTGAGQVANIQVVFDLGLYQKVSRTISLNSIQYTNILPTISLTSPANNSLNRQGVPIQLSISDDGTFTVQAYLDGSSIGQLSSPYQVSTSSWSDGSHVLRVAVTDNDGATVQSSFSFGIDVYRPSVQITYPTPGQRVPMNSKLIASVTDSHLSSVYYKLEDGTHHDLVSPYEIDMSGWTVGTYTVTVNATDLVSRSSEASVIFQIASGTVVLSLDSPKAGSVVRPGTSITFTAAGSGVMTYRWCELGYWYNLGSTGVISTTGWPDGSHSITVNATNDLGGSDQMQFTVIIDGARPTISIVSGHANLSDVDALDELQFHVTDANFNKVTWIVFGVTKSSINDQFSVSPLPTTPDGYFTVRITATDKANNTGTAIFTFLMDRGPPEVWIKNVESNDAIAPGIDLDVEVVDFFVASVRWMLDGGAKQSIEAPYIIGTQSFGAGWHFLQIQAVDGCGKYNNFSTSLYMDNTPPTVQVNALGTVSMNSSCEVSAVIEDDFKVGQARLFYELTGGPFEPVSMTLVGSNYTTTIDSSLIWDGMKIYVSANDTVGNTARSADIIIEVSDTPPDDDNGQGDDQSTSGLGWLSSLPGMMTIVAIACASVLLVFMMTRTRRVKGSGRPSHTSSSRRPSYSANYAMTSPPPRSVPASSRTQYAAQPARPSPMPSPPATQRTSNPAHRAGSVSQVTAPVRPTQRTVAPVAHVRQTAPAGPAGNDKISRVTPTSPVSELEELFTPQMMSGLQIKKAMEAERKRQREYN